MQKIDLTQLHPVLTIAALLTSRMNLAAPTLIGLSLFLEVSLLDTTTPARAPRALMAYTAMSVISGQGSVSFRAVTVMVAKVWPAPPPLLQVRLLPHMVTTTLRRAVFARVNESHRLPGTPT